MHLHKIHRLRKNVSLYGRVDSAEDVTAPRDTQEFVLYPELRQLLGHVYRFFVWHIGIRCSVNQYGGRVFR